MDHFQQLEIELQKLFLWYLDQLKRNKRIYIPILSGILKPLFLRQPVNGCIAGLSSFSVDITGDIFPCDMLVGSEYKIGNVKQGVNHKYLMKWREYNNAKNDDCCNCWVRNICGFGCKALAILNNMKKQPAIYCRYAKLLVKYMVYLIDKIDKNTMEQICWK